MKMAIYTQKCEQKRLKINNREGWNKDVLSGKKSKNLQSGEGGMGDDYSGLKSTRHRFSSLPYALNHTSNNTLKM